MAGPVKEFEVHPYVQFMMDKYSPYKKWIESEGVPIIGGAFVHRDRAMFAPDPTGLLGHAAVGGQIFFWDRQDISINVSHVNPH